MNGNTDSNRYVRVSLMQNSILKQVFRQGNSEFEELVPPQRIIILDISVSGVNIVCEEYYDENSLLLFTLVLDDKAYDALGRVKHCQKTGDTYRVFAIFTAMKPSVEKHIKMFVARMSISE